MRRVVLGAAMALVIPATADAKAPTTQHRHAYERAYRQVAVRLGTRAPGRNIDRYGLSHGALTDARLVRSTGVLRRMLAPAPAAALSTPSIPSSSSVIAAAGGSSSMDGLAQCVERAESGGDATATNGQYHGVGQWSPSAWAQDGGTRYGPDPLDATKAQQEAVLGSESDATLEQQQGQYDGC